MKKYIIIYRLILTFTIFVTAFAVVSGGIYTYHYIMYRIHFEERDENTPYSQQLPLHEMDFSVYEDCFVEALILYPTIDEIVLPCDVHYYESKEDRKPAFTIKKGTIVLVKHYVGNGYICWPDYEKEWRYGSPFEVKDTEAELPASFFEKAYYVKDAELREAAKAYFRENREVLGGRGMYTASYFARVVTQRIDRTLHYYGYFCSPHYDTY